MQELAQRNYATTEDVRSTFTTMFDPAKEEFHDQRKQIRLLLDGTNVMNDEFGEKAKEATDKIDAALADLQKRQQDVVDHLHSQSVENGQRDEKLADFHQKIAAADLSFPRLPLQRTGPSCRRSTAGSLAAALAAAEV